MDEITDEIIENTKDGPIEPLVVKVLKEVIKDYVEDPLYEEIGVTDEDIKEDFDE